MKSIAVFCGSSEGFNPNNATMAYELGQLLATESIELIYGAAKIGLMGAVARGVQDNGGICIGVIPDFLKQKEIVNLNSDELIVTENMHDRKIIMYERSDGFIIIPGGFGTLDEFFEIATWGQLGLHTKPIGVLNYNGYFDALLKQFNHMVVEGYLKQQNLDAILVDDELPGLLEKMRNFKPLPTPKWLSKEG
ncbi:MAG: TIGR00730 family Rossman fold protein, partial [Bacteroidia bacterium]|nr:TIGR00730 family Rossman fold protein [Bacteroidia bacterium]